MTLDEIMEKEKFNDVEKALVNHPMLSHPDRTKIISDIKAAKSNERRSRKMEGLTYALAWTAVMEFIFMYTPEFNKIHFLVSPAMMVLMMTSLWWWYSWYTD